MECSYWKFYNAFALFAETIPYVYLWSIKYNLSIQNPHKSKSLPIVAVHSVYVKIRLLLSIRIFDDYFY